MATRNRLSKLMPGSSKDQAGEADGGKSLRPLPGALDTSSHPPPPGPRLRTGSPLGQNRVASAALHTSESPLELSRPQRRSISSPNPPFAKPAKTGSPSFPPHTLSGLADSPLDTPLAPPPTIPAVYDEVASPQSPRSRASSASRGRKGSSAGADSGPGSRGRSPDDVIRPSTSSEAKIKKKKTWLGSGKHSREASEGQEPPPAAFVVGPAGVQPYKYDVHALLNGEKVSEIWNQNGDLFVHLSGQETGHGPSFRIDSSLILTSHVLTSLLEASSAPHHSHQNNLNVRMGDLSFDQSLRQELHLYLPLERKGRNAGPGGVAPEELDTFIGARNLFAFLVGQVLVGTPRFSTLFGIFSDLAKRLHHYEFSNNDGSTLGEAATASFLGYVEDLQLDDVRTSRQRTIQALILGERMKCWPLYNEGFAHAVGKYDELLELKSPLFSQVSQTTRNKLEKSSLDLAGRLKNIDIRLKEFYLPSLFAGHALSTSASKVIDFKAWRNSWEAMKKFVLAYYKGKYGQWPPRAKSKKNDFEEGGLNRLLLKEVYQDFSDLYDMLVDQSSVTTRGHYLISSPMEKPDFRIPHLRSILAEFDISMPPVQPPIPYDVPLLPDLSTTRRDFESLPGHKQAKERSKGLSTNEINLALMQSYNRADMRASKFTHAFTEFERDYAHGRSVNEMIDARIGQWIFLYCIIQSLPMVVIDAPGIRWTEGVEYFLCCAPFGSPPWFRDGAVNQKQYYRAAGGAIISLPADVIDHGVEGVFHRSHCWQVAARLSGLEAITIPPPQPPQPGSRPRTPVSLAAAAAQAQSQPGSRNDIGGALPMPPALNPDGLALGGGSPRSGSPAGSPRFSSAAMGLEALPVPPGVQLDATGSPNTPGSAATAKTTTFDDILGTNKGLGKKGKKK